MLKFTLSMIAALLAFAPSAQAQRAGALPYDGDIQAYGAPWRYQHRDWSSPGHPLNPGVCYYWNDHMGVWEWRC